MNDTHDIPIVLTVDFIMASAVADALALRAFASGAQPFLETRDLDRVKPEATLLPPDAVPTRTAVLPHATVVLVEQPEWTLQITRTGTSASVSVSATTQARAAAVLAQVIDGACDDEPIVDDAVDVAFWHVANAPIRRVRTITIEPWSAIARNYAAGAARSFDWLMSARPENLTGRLLLLHGPPGTGKTTAIRALTNAWRDWCRLECVLDPDRLLSQASYLVNVLERDARDAPPWRLLLLEDCDEVIRSDARRDSGQAMARLLNLTDGLLGQGRNLIVAISTNEPLSRLHPAVIRPGRCIAQVEVGRLSPAEARAWLGRSVPIDADGATLAELYALRGDLRAVEETPAVAGGLYL